MSKIEYDKELFDFVNNLSAITNSISFFVDEETNDSVHVVQSDANKSMLYTLNVPKRYFNINDTISFYKYDNFYSFLNTVKDPILEIDYDDGIIDISNSAVKINYILSDSEGILMDPRPVINFDSGDIKFTLLDDDIHEIVKINNLIKGTKANIKCVDNEIFITFYSESSDNSFTKKFDGERVGDYVDDIEFTVMADRFIVIPQKNDYSVDISKDAFIRISLIHDEIDFNLYSGEVQ